MGTAVYCCFLEKAKILMELGRFLEAEEACRRAEKDGDRRT